MNGSSWDVSSIFDGKAKEQEDRAADISPGEAVDSKCFSTEEGPLAPECILAENIASAEAKNCGKKTKVPKKKAGTCGVQDAQRALDAHNRARARYGAPPLLWSKKLANFAKTVSDTCNFQHSNGPYGENLAIGTSLSCEQAVKLWVDEESLYPPGGQPGFSSQTGHFSQVG